MAKQIHIHIRQKTRDADSLTPIFQKYLEFCRQKNIDSHSRVSFKRFVRLENLNPNVEAQLEKRARIGFSDESSSDLRQRLMTCKNEGYRARQLGKLFAENPEKEPAFRGAWGQGWREADRMEKGGLVKDANPAETAKRIAEACKTELKRKGYAPEGGMHSEGANGYYINYANKSTGKRASLSVNLNNGKAWINYF